MQQKTQKKQAKQRGHVVQVTIPQHLWGIICKEAEADDRTYAYIVRELALEAAKARGWME